MTDQREYYSLPLEDCFERISECYGVRKVIKLYIQDSVNDEKAWNSNLMTLLCESYSINCRYTELMSELILTPPSVSETTEEEVIYVDSHKYAILTSYSKLMLVNESELKHAHKVSLYIQ
tara:strand:- start:1077 stop:1436 length:360 start_codon:yes stop_codon:yes gene_type:complete